MKKAHGQKSRLPVHVTKMEYVLFFITRNIHIKLHTDTDQVTQSRHCNNTKQQCYKKIKIQKNASNNQIRVVWYRILLTKTPPSLSSIQCFGALIRFKCFFGPRPYNSMCHVTLCEKHSPEQITSIAPTTASEPYSLSDSCKCNYINI